MKKIYYSFKIFLFLIIVGIVCISGVYLYAYLCPKLEIKTANSFQIFDNKENIVSVGSFSDSWVNIENVNKNLLNATISIEDKNFYKHNGFDYLRIIKAMYVNIKNKNIKQGASTISQQYVKNLYLDFDKTWKRKLEEAFLTIQLEIDYDKDEIIEGYINTINYGQGNYGIKNASLYYFNKLPLDLSIEEATILAGIPKNPSKYNPISHLDNSLKRAKTVALAMYNNGYISKEQFNNLDYSSISIFNNKNILSNDMLLFYKDAVMEELNNIESIPKSLITSGGLKIYTELDVTTQEDLENAINSIIPDEDSVETANIIVNPNTGGIIALVGGRNYAKSQYNRVTQAKRQVGSTMKPFLYYAALENNFVSSSTFTSEATTFALDNGKSYSPTNYGNKYANKQITMAAALALSDNIYAVKTNMYLGPETMIEIAKRTGIKGNLLAVPSLALGTSEINMLDYARGYTTFASGGYKKELHFINKVLDLEGNTLYEFQDENELVLNPNYTYILNEMMTNTTNPNFIDYAKPSALSIKDLLLNKYAIKTGTTGTDFYLVGYNPDFLMLSWVGYDDSKDLELNKNIYTKKIFAETIEKYFKNHTYKWYDIPKNVVGIPKNAITGDDANTTSNSAIYYYVKGTENYVFKEKED